MSADVRAMARASHVDVTFVIKVSQSAFLRFNAAALGDE